jgi:hypothetical protein
MYIDLHAKCPLFLSDFNESCIFSTDFRNILIYQISWKSVHWEPSCLMSAGRRTDKTKLPLAFRNYGNALKNYTLPISGRQISTQNLANTKHVQYTQNHMIRCAILYYVVCSFYHAPSGRAALMQRKPPSAGTCRNSCRVHGHDKRHPVHALEFLVITLTRARPKNTTSCTSLGITSFRLWEMDLSLHIFLISASDAGCWTTFPPEGAPVALERRLCTPHSRPGHGAEQICALEKSKPVAYWAILPPIHHFNTHIIFITLKSQTNWWSRTAPGRYPLAATDWDGQSNKKRRNAGVSMGNNGKHVLQIRTVAASWSLQAATPCMIQITDSATRQPPGSNPPSPLHYVPLSTHGNTSDLGSGRAQGSQTFRCV